MGSTGPRARSWTLEETEYAETLLSLFEKHLIGTRSNSRKTVQIAMQAIRSFMHYVGLPPWAWDENDLSDFLTHKARQKNIGVGRQATYITYLRSFQNYIMNARGLVNEIHRRFGTQPQRFVTDENAIPIKRKNHVRKKIMTPLTASQCQALVEHFDIAIRQAKAMGGKSFNTLRRDKVMTITLLLTGIRVDELIHVRISHFQADPKYPNFGGFALLTVIGKGTKIRVVRLYNPMINPVMTWYLDEVRPAFLSTKTRDPELLFLSERGHALCSEQVRRMLLNIGSAAGIPTRITPHLLRHTYATEMAGIIGPEALQHQLGHEYLSTTLGTYYHQNPELVGNQIQQGIENLTKGIDAMIGDLIDENHHE